jgi:hypothetical protein
MYYFCHFCCGFPWITNIYIRLNNKYLHRVISEIGRALNPPKGGFAEKLLNDKIFIFWREGVVYAETCKVSA